jgi:hypothetical protein
VNEVATTRCSCSREAPKQITFKRQQITYTALGLSLRQDLTEKQEADSFVQAVGVHQNCLLTAAWLAAAK